MTEQYGPWIYLTHSVQPVASGVLVQAEMGFVGSRDYVGPIPAEYFDWYCPGDPVVRYRLLFGEEDLRSANLNAEVPA